MMVNSCKIEILQRLCMYCSLKNEEEPRHDTSSTNFDALSGQLVMSYYVKELGSVTRSTFRS